MEWQKVQRRIRQTRCDTVRKLRKMVGNYALNDNMLLSIPGNGGGGGNGKVNGDTCGYNVNKSYRRRNLKTDI